MTDERPTMGVLHHLPPRKPLSGMEEFARDVGETIAAHFREQNEILRAERQEQDARVREQGERLQRQGEMIERLTRGVELLVTELHGLRTGKAEEAFARVAGSGASPDLPTVSAEAAVIYTCTAASIGRQLGFRASEIGVLLGAKGLRWAGDGAYQELGRDVGPNHTKFWHREVPERLRRVLDENNPARHGITDKSALAVFRKWKARQAPNLLDGIGPAPERV
ncbi:hypothetical protein NBEOAGPD_0615 [Methylobacterium gregans]|uniref:Uncharacterized protein n=2 Tax=Methylobacterium gregans TaxID=374424 RepID=A0AA37HL75_9HYPH|nr:hypothetical protein NBEOAGPD_0615 [Methylobacterium gregans]